MCVYCTDDYLNRKKYRQENSDGISGVSWFIKDQFMGDTMPRVLEVTAWHGIEHQTTLLVPIRSCPNCGKELKHPWETDKLPINIE